MTTAPAASIAPAVPVEGTLFALVIETGHSSGVTIHRSHDGALAYVDAFVAEWWDTEMCEDKPEDAAEARAMYFEKMAEKGEGYTIVETAIMD